MAIELPRDDKKRAIASIRRYFEEELGEDIGDLKAELMLDFVLCELGPSIYNKAVADALAFLADRTTDLEATCYEPEFPYWPRTREEEP